MRAYVINEFGEPDVFKEANLPDPTQFFFISALFPRKGRLFKKMLSDLSGRFKVRKRREGPKKYDFRLPGRGINSSLIINFPREGKKRKIFK